MSLRTFYNPDGVPIHEDKSKYRNPPAPPGVVIRPEDCWRITIKRDPNDELDFSIYDYVAESGLFDEPDCSIYDHFVINSDSESEEDEPCNDEEIKKEEDDAENQEVEEKIKEDPEKVDPSEEEDDAENQEVKEKIKEYPEKVDPSEEEDDAENQEI